MDQAESILVVILAAALAVFLCLAIVLIVKCIQIANSVKRISAKAEHLVDNAASVGEFFKAASGKFAVGKVVSNIVSSVMHHNQKKGRQTNGKE